MGHSRNSEANPQTLLIYVVIKCVLWNTYRCLSKKKLMTSCGAPTITFLNNYIICDTIILYHFLCNYSKKETWTKVHGNLL